MYIITGKTNVKVNARPKNRGEFGYTFTQHFDDEWLYGLQCYEVRENLSILGEIHGGATKEFTSPSPMPTFIGQTSITDISIKLREDP